RQRPAESVRTSAENAAEPWRVAVHVPGLDVAKFLAGRRADPGGDAHEAHAGFDQTPGHEQVLAERLPAVAVAYFCRLAVRIECQPGVRAGYQVEGSLLKPPEAVSRARRSRRTLAFQISQQLLTLLQPLRGNFCRRIKGRDAEPGR